MRNLAVFTLILFALCFAKAAPEAMSEYETSALTDKFMGELKTANKTYKWNPSIYEEKSWKIGGKSIKGRPLIYWECGTNNENTTLILSTVHGDEITPVYFGLRLVSWLKGEPDLCKKYRIIVAPLINPDGFLEKKPVRTNANGVDLNRNFPTSDFDKMAIKLWKDDNKSHPRRFPGEKGGSETETQFQMWLIDNYKPQKILTVHSPLNFFDYDGPEDDEFKTFAKEYVSSCEELRTSVKKASINYNFLRYGFYPGSLGNYAGKERGIPTLTLELPTVDSNKARDYFERLKQGTKVLITYEIKGSAKPKTK